MSLKKRSYNLRKTPAACVYVKEFLVVVAKILESGEIHHVETIRHCCNKVSVIDELCMSLISFPLKL